MEMWRQTRSELSGVEWSGVVERRRERVINFSARQSLSVLCLLLSVTDLLLQARYNVTWSQISNKRQQIFTKLSSSNKLLALSSLINTPHTP